MYRRFFGLSSKPFAISPDPEFLFASPQHAAALTMLEYAMESQAGFCVLTGAIGSGKTTLLRKLMRTCGPSYSVGLVSHTHARFESVLPWILSSLGIASSAVTEVAQYEAFTQFVIAEYAKGRRVLVVFDEAQNLSVAALEELRLLSNVNSENDVAMQVLLVGQPELRVKLERPELQQFAQRVSVDFHLEGLSPTETAAYIEHRLAIAGSRSGLFEDAALAYVHTRSRGIPRLINQICDLALVYAFAESSPVISESLIRQVLEERGRGRAIPLFGPERGAAIETPPTRQRI